MPDKVEPALGSRAHAGLAALVRRDLPRLSIRYFVADDAGEVVGTARLAIGQEPSPDGIGPLARAVGWPRAIRAAFVLGLLVHARLDADEAYVEELAVRADRRREGVGTALLATCESAALGVGKRRTTLWVTERNIGAISLYRHAGYRVIRRRSTLRGRLMFGAPVALLMEKRLP